MKRDGWTRLSPPGRKCDTWWRHDATGWEIRHCGHPTANWQYYATDSRHPETVKVTHNGLGFYSLLHAFECIDGVISGRYETTDENCVDGIRRMSSYIAPSKGRGRVVSHTDGLCDVEESDFGLWTALGEDLHVIEAKELLKELVNGVFSPPAWMLAA